MTSMAAPRGYRGKRGFDLLVVMVVIAPALVIGVLCAISIKVTSSGPVFFRQERVGRDGKVFRIWKFRTMLAGKNPTIPTADRITRTGRFLRRTSLDELPQLLNVATGAMSIVGPRPTLPYQVERWTDEQRRRLGPRPGLTGLAQVRGRNDLPWAERIEHDLDYVERQSLWLDLRIVARTGSAMISGTGTGLTSVQDPIARVVESVS